MEHMKQAKQLKQVKEYFIKTQRIGFSTWAPKDIEDATALWGNSEVTKYIVATGNMSHQQIAERLDKELDNFENWNVQYYPIYLLETNEICGCCGLRPYNIEENLYEFGIHLIDKFWGKGLAQEAGLAMIKYAFDSIGVDALFAGHNPKNIAPEGLLKKLGFTFTHKEFYKPTGLYHPSYLLKKDDIQNVFASSQVTC